ncbi:MAG: tryptophan synthase alpha chain [Thermoplasmata archaeon]|jgi:tryptophan synthase alpha chain|nr:tryptophan synthase alpha chain [Thermoplasmata archaeon]
MPLDAMRDAHAGGPGVLHVYHPLGYPDAQRSESYVGAALAAGAGVAELGIPFSDPVADGPVLQAASAAALAQGTTPRSALATLAALRRRHPRAGLVAMAYANTLHRLGWADAARLLREAGADGVIVPDMPLAEARRVAPRFAHEGVPWVPIVSSTVPAPAVRALAACDPPFLYVASLGVTGRDGPGAEAAATLARVRREAPRVPVVLGFGVRDAGDVRSARAAGAHGVVVGSALVRRIADGATPEEHGAAIARLQQACR